MNLSKTLFRLIAQLLYLLESYPRSFS